MLDGFRSVPKTGVIYVMEKAHASGYFHGNEQWSNLGQGAPETTTIPLAPERLASISVDSNSAEYGSVAGYYPLREAIADLYNHRYRKSSKTKFKAENVAICAGGRLALVRIAMTIDNINLGHFIPDYTAYEELLTTFSHFSAIPIALSTNEFCHNINKIEEAMVNLGLGAILLSNPCNPTGTLLKGEQLKKFIKLGNQYQCNLIFDEFYSHYIYDQHPQLESISAANYINDVNKDNILIIDGLTKNWRYPGLRLSWTIGPEKIIENICAAGSFLDGGAPHAIQKEIIPMLHPDFAKQEAIAIQQEFDKKRHFMLNSLAAMDIQLPHKPQGGFYCFAPLYSLPSQLQDGMEFFSQLLEQKVICVPGEFFDVNPGKRRKSVHSRLNNFVRLSYGPSMQEIALGLNRIKHLIASAQHQHCPV